MIKTVIKIAIKTTGAAIVAGAFLISVPARLAHADDKAEKGTVEKTTKTEKTEKTEKKEKKTEKPAGGGW